MMLRFLLAGLCTASLIPFSLYFVVGSEGPLLEKAAEMATAMQQRGDRYPGEGKSSSSSVAQTRDLIGEWTRMNYVRTLFPLIGTLLVYSAY